MNRDNKWLKSAVALTANHPTEDEECLDHCDNPECHLCIGAEQCCKAPQKQKQEG